MFDFNLTPEQIAAAEAYAQQQQQQQAGNVAQQAQEMQQAMESPPVAPPVMPPAVPPAGPRGPGMLMGEPEMMPQTPPYVPPPSPQTPVPPAPQMDVGAPEQLPQQQQVAAPSTQQPAAEAPAAPDPNDPYKNPLDEYYVTDAQNKAEGYPTDVYVSGTGREDENGLSQAGRLEILDAANQELVPEGYETGFQGSYLIHLMYGGGLNPSEKALNPDYAAGQNGDTVGGISNTDAWGKDINWSNPQTATGSLGQVINTPAGDYLVVNGAEGNLALMPLDGAKAGVGKFFYNMTNGEHHVGIDPKTGEVWYQQAAGYTTFEGNQWTNPAYSGSNSGSTAEPVTGTFTGPDNGSPDSSPPQSPPSPQPSAPTPPPLTNPYALSGGGAFSGIGYTAQQQQTQPQEEPKSQQKVDYVKLLNKMMAQSLFKDMT